jgi:hypothetical protein
VACVDLSALLQFGDNSMYERKTYDDYFEVFRALLAADGESSLSANGNFQYIVA